MNEFKIELKKEQANLLNSTAEVTALLNKIFQPFSQNFDKLKYEIQREFKAGGSPEVTRMNFDRVQFDSLTGKGSFRVVLDINFTFGCEDILTEKKDQTSEWSFFIDHNNNEISFKGSPYLDYRSTADEF